MITPAQKPPQYSEHMAGSTLLPTLPCPGMTIARSVELEWRKPCHDQPSQSCYRQQAHLRGAASSVLCLLGSALRHILCRLRGARRHVLCLLGGAPGRVLGRLRRTRGSALGSLCRLGRLRLSSRHVLLACLASLHACNILDI
jgi:hypothetical protein